MTEIYGDIIDFADADGFVSDREFIDAKFRLFQTHLVKQIRDVTFKRGGLEYGGYLSLFLAHLENVTFENFKCGRIQFFPAQSTLKNVTFKGSKMASLYGPPHANLANEPNSPLNCKNVKRR